MRIAHVVYQCEPGRYLGGVQKMVYELARAQAERGDDVEIITIGDRPTLPVGERLKIRYFPGQVYWGSFAIREVLFREHARFDVIHSHNTFLPLNRFVAATARRFSRPVFFHAHGALDPVLLAGWHPKALKKWLYDALVERPNLNTARGVIGLTREECRQLQLFGVKMPIYEVGNGIAFQPTPTAGEAGQFRTSLGVGAEVPLVLFVGRISPKKKIHTLVEAMLTVRAAVPAARLAICGDRSMEPRYTATLDALIERHRLGPAIHWAGFLDERGKRGAFGAARVFAHPSESEGMALAILEAMSFGIPAVVTPGCYMQRAAAAGALVEVRPDPAALGAAIAGLLTDDEAHGRLSRTAAAYARREYDWPTLAERLDKIYRGRPDACTVYSGNPAAVRLQNIPDSFMPPTTQAEIASGEPGRPTETVGHQSDHIARSSTAGGEEARELFDSIATTWEEKYQDDGSMTHRRQRFLRLLDKHVPRKGRLLDFGCASGDLSTTFHGAGFRVSGVDQAPAMVARARARFGAEVDFKLLRPEQQDGIALPFAAGEFSAIVASSVAEYLVPVSSYLREWHRVSAPGAILLVTVPNPMHPLRWMETAEIILSQASRASKDKISDRARYLQTSVNRYRAFVWRMLLAEAGWTWVDAEGWFHPLLMVVAKKDPVEKRP